MNDKPLAGKVALVTGGGKGIGRETARILAGFGARVFICGRDEQALIAAVQTLVADGGLVEHRSCDVRDPEACRHLIEHVKVTAGRLDILVNNAGMSMRGTLEHSAIEVIRAMVEINYLGAAYVTHYAIPLLRASHGSVTFISSLSALHGLPFIAPYGSSKLALKGLAESLRAELHAGDVHVGLVHVGFTENDPDKVILHQDGSLEKLHRPKNSHTQYQAARAIVRSILRRKPECTLTLTGHLAAFVYRFFPRLSDWIITRFAGMSGMYGPIPDEQQTAEGD